MSPEPEPPEPEPPEPTSIIGEWLLNEVIDLSGYTKTTYSISFTAEGVSNSCTSIIISSSNINYKWGATAFDGIVAYESQSWNNPQYRNITITGGDDIENTNFITWLNAHATKIS